MVPPIEPVQRFRVPVVVAAQLRKLLISGEYKVGDRLPSEKVLGERFGVGRSSVREAMRRLEADGLVRIVHGVGSFVSDGREAGVGDRLAALLVLDGSTIPELFEARRVLERETAARAAERLTDTEADELRELLSRLEDETLSEEAYVEADVALHLAISRVTKNKVLIRLIESLESLLLEYSRRVIQLPGRRVTANVGHKAIVEAILARRSSGARKAMIEHIAAVEREIVEHLGRG